MFPSQRWSFAGGFGEHSLYQFPLLCPSKLEAILASQGVPARKKNHAKALAVHRHCSFRNFECRDRRVLSLGLQKTQLTGCCTSHATVVYKLQLRQPASTHKLGRVCLVKRWCVAHFLLSSWLAAFCILITNESTVAKVECYATILSIHQSSINFDFGFAKFFP